LTLPIICCTCLCAQMNPVRSVCEVEQCLVRSPSDQRDTVARGIVYALSGQADQVRQLLSHDGARTMRRVPSFWVWQLSITVLGDQGQALQFTGRVLSKARKARWCSSRINPNLSLSEDERFQGFARPDWSDQLRQSAAQASGALLEADWFAAPPGTSV